MYTRKHANIMRNHQHCRISTATLTVHVYIESHQVASTQKSEAFSWHTRERCSGMFEIDAPLLGTPIPLFSLQESTPKVGGSTIARCLDVLPRYGHCVEVARCQI